MSQVVALIGDIHGEFDKSLAALKQLEIAHACKSDFILQAGDLVPVPNKSHLKESYRETEQKKVYWNDFPNYLKGDKKISAPMYFVAGNHEPFSYLETGHPNGGMLCPNLHYLGRSGSTQIDGCDVSYLSGIYGEKYFQKDRPKYPTNNNEKPSMKRHRYFNQSDIDAIKPNNRPDFLLLHDWPANLVTPINEWLNNKLNVPVEQLVRKLKPRIVVCGHFHDQKQTTPIIYSDGSKGMIVTLGGSEFKDDASDHIQLLRLDANTIKLIN